MLSSHTLSLLHSRDPVSPGGESVHVSGTPVFTSGIPVFVAAAEGMPLDHLALWPAKLAFLGPTGL